METAWQEVGIVGVYSFAALLCLIGFILSCLSLSGTWIVLCATGLLAWTRWPEFPGIATLIVFLILCIGVEVTEALASAWGVQKRGGSKGAGWAALAGGFLGMVLGGLFIPVPVIGSLIGMLAGSFGCAFWAEHSRLKRVSHAAHVATGAVLARIAVIFLKVGVTIGMIFVLGVGIGLS